MEIKICHLYPDLLSLNGDRGNILSLRKRLIDRGISAEITPLCAGEKADFSRFDLFFIGGSQDFEQNALLDDLVSGKASEIRAAAEDGKTFLAVSGGFAAMGSTITAIDGEKRDYIGVLDMQTANRSARLTGNTLLKYGDIMVVGFENHAGYTYLGDGCTALGTVIFGKGNNGEDSSDGARYKNVFGTYSNGPILPKNPEFCDLILSTALLRKYGTAELVPLANRFENAAHAYMLERLSAK